MAEVVCGMGYNIVCDSALYKENRGKLLEIPLRYGYEVIEINLEADLPVLEERFKKRVADALIDGAAKISNTSIERFRELNEIYEREKNISALTLRTDSSTVEEVTKRVFELI